MPKIQATVIYPITVEIETSWDEEFQIVEKENYDVIEIIRERIKEQADKIFKTSTISPIIHDCEIESLIE